MATSIASEPDLAAPCCTRPPHALTASDAEKLAALFKAVSDPVRLRILSLIAAAPDGEICVCEITPAFDLSGPTISHHLKTLRSAGVIEGERRGTWVYYTIAPDALASLSAHLDQLRTRDRSRSDVT